MTSSGSNLILYTVYKPPNSCDYSNADFTKLNEFLAEVEWYKVLEDLNIEDSWNYFKKKLQEGVDSCIPMKSQRIGNKPMWMKQNVL